MANSNNRIKGYETVHHLVSRIAHRVYFLKDDERKDFLEIVRRTADFTGIRLIGWCVMSNHFHLLVHLPSPEELSESEIVRRYGVLKGQSAASDIERAFAEWRKIGEAGDVLVSEWLERQRSRMYSVASFMKIVKQWFTVEYNRRNAHKGTLWEAAYHDRPVKRTPDDLVTCLAYIHLNPIRAAVTDRFDGYPWSSYSAFRRGEPIATEGLRFVYGGDYSCDELADMHEELLVSLLEEEKLRRAEEIARRRAAGYEVPPDPLTTEAMIAQQAARLKEVQNAALEFCESQVEEGRRSEKKRLQEQEVISLLGANPEMNVPQIAERMSIGISVAYKILQKLKKSGMIAQDGYCGRWIVNRTK